MLLCREKEEAEKEAENSERKSAEEVNQSKPKSSAVKSKVDDDDITDLYDMEHYDSDEDLEGIYMY